MIKFALYLELVYEYELKKQLHLVYNCFFSLLGTLKSIQSKALPRNDRF